MRKLSRLPGRLDEPVNHVGIACQEQTEFVDVARAPCQHEYCRPCSEDLFKALLTDESLFPPRRCGRVVGTSQERRPSTVYGKYGP
jgi:hypothetical protein